MNKNQLMKLIEGIVSELGYGLRESIYQNALAVELRSRKHLVELEVNTSVMYKSHDVGTVRLDMLIDREIIIEFKAIQKVTKKEKLQIENYLRIKGMKIGFLVNVSTDCYLVEEVLLNYYEFISCLSSK